MRLVIARNNIFDLRSRSFSNGIRFLIILRTHNSPRPFNQTYSLCNIADGNQHILLTVIPIEIQLILPSMIVSVDIIFTTASDVE